MNHLYDGKHEPRLKIIDVFICKLRKKLSQATGGEQYIETVWGRGYKLREPSAATPECPWRVAAASSSSVSISARSAVSLESNLCFKRCRPGQVGHSWRADYARRKRRQALRYPLRRRETSRTASSGRRQSLQWHKPARRQARSAASFFFKNRFCGSSRIIGLISFSAGFAVDRVGKAVAVRDADHLPDADQLAEQVALAAADAGHAG